MAVPFSLNITSIRTHNMTTDIMKETTLEKVRGDTEREDIGGNTEMEEVGEAKEEEVDPEADPVGDGGETSIMEAKEHFLTLISLPVQIHPRQLLERNNEFQTFCIMKRRPLLDLLFKFLSEC